MVHLDLSSSTPFKGEVFPLIGSFFSPELIKEIDSARLSILCVQYQWKWNIHQRHSKVQELGASIGRARLRNIPVSVILNSEAPGRHLTKINQVTGDQLARMGCSIKQLKLGALLHAKLWIIDNKVSFVGSHNISTRSLTANEEVSVKIKSVKLACIFKQYFERLWGC